MDRFSMLVFVCLLFAGCGPVESDGVISERCEGFFAGTATTTNPGAWVVTRGAEFWVDVADGGTTAELGGFCDGNESLHLVGEGTVLTTIGTPSCAMAMASCSSAVFVVTELNVTLYSGDSLNVVGEGSLVGCDSSTPIRIVFDGQRNGPPPGGIVNY